MKKSDLIATVAAKAKITNKAAEDVVNIIFQTMKHALIRGDRIELRGLGSFSVKKYGAYIGRNPKTGEKIQVRNKSLPFFRVGKMLRDRLAEAGRLEAEATASGGAGGDGAPGGGSSNDREPSS